MNVTNAYYCNHIYCHIAIAHSGHERVAQPTFDPIAVQEQSAEQNIMEDSMEDSRIFFTNDFHKCFSYLEKYQESSPLKEWTPVEELKSMAFEWRLNT